MELLIIRKNEIHLLSYGNHLSNAAGYFYTPIEFNWHNNLVKVLSTSPHAENILSSTFINFKQISNISQSI